ncbi:MAG: 4-hydroxy-3-methylbut-2-enyl diphosphate reductase [Clostridia bacterium]|nr:4-hydroxy-3-methylbut-2-enyl diphosphate reductase [Clostridia bacterium]
MTIRLAEKAGFCFGVRRAADALEAALSEKEKSGSPRRIVTLGNLIHNDEYLRSVRARGAECASREDIPDLIRAAEKGENITLIIRAHGEKETVVGELEAVAGRVPNFTLLDCTCPYVEKVRATAKENSGKDKFFILIGDPHHPEVEGIMSCLDGDGIALRDSAELEKWLAEGGNAVLSAADEVSAASQTTQLTAEWKKCQGILKKVCTNVRIFDTICKVTEERQSEAERLAEESDAVIVIGSKESSNSRKLFEVCRRKCGEVYFVGCAADAARIHLPEKSRVSVTAGASTPEIVIQEVVRTMSEQTENFAEMYEQSLKTINSGDIVEGVVSNVTNTEIQLDLGTKTTGIITHDKATHDPQAKLTDLYHVGDVIKAKVIKVSDVEGIAMLDKNRVDSDLNWDKIVAAYESGEILEGKIRDAVKGGVIIELFGVRVFIPASLTGVPRDNDLDILVGTTQRVKIIEIKTERKKAYASIRAVQREERRAKEEEFWANIEEGQEFDGEVRSLTSYGAFVDLGGVDGMVHNSELSWLRIKHPSEVVNVGDVIHVTVKSLDREKKRVSLSYKTDGMNPWRQFTEKYSVGDEADVRIVSIMPFGAFAELVPGVDGLIHISQITDHKIARPDEVVKVGDVVHVKITAVEEASHRISLSIRALMEPSEEIPEAEEAEEAPVEEAPVEEAPAEEAPIEEAPAEEAPAEEAPAEEAPAEEAPVEEAPAEE